MMALAGSPDGKEEYDSEMVSSYLRLISDPSIANDSPEYMPKVSNAEERKVAKLLIEKGFRLEPDPQGNIAMGYGCVSVQRRSNWSAVARGHSRYLWAAEHYLGANLYGRYLAHGSLQILTAAPGQTVTPATSGWQQEGFDWNRIPGVTSIHLPLEQLQAKVLNVDSYSGIEEMLYSDEAFAGGLSQQKMNGNFGMKLHEHDKYNGSHRARKSYHFIDGMIVCLGSDIEIQIRSSRQKRLSSNWQLLIKQGMIIGKIIKEIRKYGWTIWERVIMFQLPSGLRRTFLNTRECKIQERKQRVIGFLWL